MCSQVVRFAKIRKLWNESKQATIRKKIAMNRSPTMRTTLGFRREIPRIPSLKNTASSAD